MSLVPLATNSMSGRSWTRCSWMWLMIRTSSSTSSRLQMKSIPIVPGPSLSCSLQIATSEIKTQSTCIFVDGKASPPQFCRSLIKVKFSTDQFRPRRTRRNMLPRSNKPCPRRYGSSKPPKGQVTLKGTR